MDRAISAPRTIAPELPPTPAPAPRQPPRLSLRNRYSLFVTTMKVILPATAAALILLVVAWPHLTAQREGFRIDVADLGLEQAKTLSMVNARFDGIDERNRPYTITADVATQSSSNENLITLEAPKADITLEDGAWLALSAREGRYDRGRNRLELSGEVSLFHDKGFEIRTESARIDLARGTAEGSEPVTGHGAAGSLVGKGFRILDRGRRIIVLGKSRLILLPGAQEAVR
ncbi:MAG: LPS export ABC transporter periplasmic protein LptC [Planctomycetota bacterium]|nr:MAG: LPS export ABC transporter periplasmic protein LptC [Planctomycetota bacterium]